MIREFDLPPHEGRVPGFDLYRVPEPYHRGRDGFSAAPSRGRQQAPCTITGYVDAVTRFGHCLADVGMPRDVTAIRREHVESWVVARPTGEDPIWHAPRAVHDRSRYRRTLRLAWPSRRSKRSVASTPAT